MTPRSQRQHGGPAAAHRAWARVRTAAVGLSLAIAGAAWAAPTVVYTAIDLDDGNSGVDRWRYDYTITGFIEVGGSLNLFYKPALYSSLLASSSDANIADPASTMVQPDVGLPADGIVYVAPAVTDLLAGDATSLSVEFVWLGGANSQPGAQGFEVVAADFTQTSTGQTSSSAGGTVPEPSGLWLTATALLGLALRRKTGQRPS